MNGYASLAWNGFREARRNRVTVVVGFFALVTIASSVLITQLTVVTFRRVLVDMGLGLMSLILVFLAIFLSSGLLSREIERRTIFLIVTKPVSRSGFLVARFAGTMLTLLVLQAVMTVLFVLELKLYGFPIGPSVSLALAMFAVELFVVTALGFFFSSFLSQTVSALVTIGVYLAGQFSPDLYRFGDKLSGLGRAAARGLYYLLPAFDRLSYRALATYDLVPERSAVLRTVLYGLGYGVGLLVVACLVFERRDFK